VTLEHNRWLRRVELPLMKHARSALLIDGLVAVTYMTKAQAELAARIRRVLGDTGAGERAQQIPLAYLGTVHSVRLRLLKEFALDAGLSPAVDVIPGNEGRRLLQAGLERELDPSFGHASRSSRSTCSSTGMGAPVALTGLPRSTTA